MASSKRRKLLVALGMLVGILVLLVLLTPLWVPWLLRPTLTRYDVEFDRYDRVGYTRLSLHDVSYSRTNLTFHAQTVEVHQPALWLWRRWRQQHTAEDVRVEGWKLTLIRDQETERDGIDSLPELLETMDEAIAQLDPWIATAYLGSGQVQVDDQNIAVPRFQWNRGSFNTQLIYTNLDETISAVASGKLLPETKRLNVAVSPYDIESNLVLDHDRQQAQLSGTLHWRTNRLQLNANFGIEDFLPQTAFVESRQFRIPADLLRLEGYQDLSGSFSANWQANQFKVDLDAIASPLDHTNLPPVRASIHAAGTTNFVRIQEAQIATPWLQARLSTNVIFNFQGELLSPEAAIWVAIDLNKQDFIDARGRFTGEAFLQRSETRYPYARFRLDSEGFAGYGVRLDSVQLAG
ncbi:MAG: hypothetical protein ACK4UN_00195, partial [Limisphaerales bacterium]